MPSAVPPSSTAWSCWIENRLEFKKVPEPADDSDKAAKAVVAADKELNAAYQALRGKMDDTARDALKEEQIEWLQERDHIADDWQRSRSQKAGGVRAATLSHTASASSRFGSVSNRMSCSTRRFFTM